MRFQADGIELARSQLAEDSSNGKWEQTTAIGVTFPSAEVELTVEIVCPGAFNGIAAFLLDDIELTAA